MAIMAHEASGDSRHTPDDTWFSKVEAAEYLNGLSLRTIDNYIARGDLPAYRLRGSRLVRIRKSDLDAMLVEIPTGGAA